MKSPSEGSYENKMSQNAHVWHLDCLSVKYTIQPEKPLLLMASVYPSSRLRDHCLGQTF